MKTVGGKPRLWAVDANIAMSQSLRRLLSGVIELADGRLVVPQRVLDLMRTRYRRMVKERAVRMTEWQEEKSERALGEEERKTLIVHRVMGMESAFAEWAEAETRRNDGIWTRAQDTEASREIATRMLLDGIAGVDVGEHVEEDASVAAQALDAGCGWIASHNRLFLTGPGFEDWVRNEQARGRLRNAGVPFLRTADEAIEELLDFPREWADRPRYRLSAIAWELGRPGKRERAEDSEFRVTNLSRQAEALRRSGAVRAAQDIGRLVREYRRREGLLARLLDDHHPGAMDHTRDAEERQRRAEQDVVRRTWLQAVERGNKRTAGRTGGTDTNGGVGR